MFEISWVREDAYIYKLSESRERNYDQPIGFDGHSNRSINDFMQAIVKLR